MTTEPVPTLQEFVTSTGYRLKQSQEERAVVLLGRARRHLKRDVATEDIDFSDPDDLADWVDAVSELTWLYLEAESNGSMSMMALPVVQLSLGTLFWTKGGPMPRLTNVQHLVKRFGVNSAAGRARIVLDEELAYP